MTEPGPWLQGKQAPPSRLKGCRGNGFRQWLACGYVDTFWHAERVFARWEQEYSEQVFALYRGFDTTMDYARHRALLGKRASIGAAYWRWRPQSRMAKT